MKTYLKYLVVIFFAMLSACKKDSMPVASDPVADAYVRTDNTSSEIDHQIYLVYQQTQIPILYTDTLRKNPLQVINLNYEMAGSNSSYTYTYPKNKADILTGIAFVRDKILPPLGPNIKIHSLTLLDTLKIVQVYGPTYSITTNYNVIPALTTFGIANIPRIATMTCVELATYKADIFTNLLINPLTSSTLLADFYKVSSGFYSGYAYLGATSSYYLPFKDKREYGFILDGTESPYYFTTPDEAGDVKLFLSNILTMSAADFQTLNGNYPLVMNKYNLLKTALTTLGFDLTKV